MQIQGRFVYLFQQFVQENLNQLLQEGLGELVAFGREYIAKSRLVNAFDSMALSMANAQRGIAA